MPGATVALEELGLLAFRAGHCCGAAVTDELWRLGAGELAGMIRAREVRSREVVDAHLRRIESVNGSLNAITVTLAESALEAAEHADARLTSGEEVPPLHGVPFTVKETVDVAGSATTWGVGALERAIPEVDAPAVAQLRRAGAIAVARTNTPDFALRYHTDSVLRGATVNPWDASRSPGGSSGGEAAALAAGMTPLGVGSDYGGSVRVPAQFCGVCSLRTTLGRVAFAAALPPEDFPIGRQLMMVLGPMARRVSDLRLALEHMCGEDPRDPWWTPAPLSGPPTSRRVSVWRAADDPAVADGIDAALAALEDAGYEIDDVEPPMVEDAARLFWALAACEIRFRLTALRPLFGADALRFLDTMFELAADLDRAGYIEGLQARQGIARAWSLFQAERPLILSAVSTRPPFPVGRDLEGPEQVGELIESMRCAVTINLLGLPAVAVPVGVSDRLPQGVQLIGPRYREDLCLDAAEAIEHRLGIITPIDPT